MREEKSPLLVKNKRACRLRRWVCYLLLGVLTFFLAVVASHGEAYAADGSGATLYAVSPLRQQMMLSDPAETLKGGYGFMMPLTVVAKDADGRPLAGTPVTFEVSQGKNITAQMRGYKSRIVTVTTDANGMASAVNTYPGFGGEGYQLISYLVGSIETLEVKASIPGGNPVIFSVQVGAYKAKLIDTTPPLISVSAKDDTGAVYTAGEWTNHSVTVSYDAKDTLSAIKSCTSPQVFEKEGDTQEAACTAVDIAENSSSVKFGPICIDKSAPETKAAVINETTAQWNNDKVTVKFDSTDNLSGTVFIYYRLGSGEPVKLDGPSATADIETEGINELSYWAVDKAGNKETPKTKNINIDKSAPSVAAKISPDSNEKGWNSTNVTVNLTAADSYSGVREIHYKIGNNAADEVAKGDKASFIIDTEGVTDVTYWAVDNVGNTSPQNNVQVKIDKSNPVVLPPKDITVEATAVKTLLDIGTAKVEDAGKVTLSNDAPKDGFTVGTTTVIWKAIDEIGNMTEATQKITVRDTIAPILTVQGDVVVEAAGAGTKVSLPQATAKDIFPVAISNDAPEEFPVGERIVTWTAEDANKNITKATEKVIVIDSKKPVLTVPGDITTEATARRTPVKIGQATATDIFKVDISSNAPPDYPVGTATVTWKATDANGNETTGDQKITVRDTTPPDLVIPADITVEATQRKMVLDIGKAQATDIFNVTVTDNAPEDYTVGTKEVTWRAEDENHNITTKVQKITVTDTKKPVIKIPETIKVEATGKLTPVQLKEPEATDVFPVTVSGSYPEGMLFPIGSTTIKWRVTDSNGNEATVDQIVNVVDTTKPLLTLPKDITVEATAIKTPVDIGQAIAEDIFDVDIKKFAPDAYPIGTTKVTWSATDANGNTTTGVQNVTVEDTRKPVISIPGDKRVEATAIRTPVAIGKATATDIFPVNIENDAPADNYPIGSTPVTWTATDENKNSDSKIQNITIVDTTKPLLIIPADITMEATALMTPVDIGKAEATDIFPVTIEKDAPADGYPVGVTKVTWKATDANGNVSEAVQNIIIKDTKKPELTVPKDISVEATARQTPVDIGSATGKDIFPVKVKNNAPEAFPLGTTVVTWTATDANGNETTKAQNVTVTDKTCPNLEVPGDITTEATAIATPVTIGEAKASDIFNVVSKNDAPKEYPLGKTKVTWVATDENGNTTTKVQVITITDHTPPELNIPGDITKEATAKMTPAELGEATADDIFGATSGNNAPEAYPVGTTEVTWRATDGNGLITEKIQKVTITDLTPPVLHIPENITTEATARMSPVKIGEASAEDIFDVGITNNAPQSYALGTKEVVWTAKDEHGNVTEATQKVTVQDTTPPELTIPDDITVEATAVLSPVQIGKATATDIFDVVITNDAPKDGYPVATTEVTWKAVDENGNVTTKVQKVTVTDKTNPIIKAPADITKEATARLTPVDKGNAEASDIFKVEVKNDAPDSFAIGTKTVTWTATDEHGNTSTDTQEITIQDTTPPELTIPHDITVEATAVLTPVQIGEAKASDIFDVVITNDAPKDGYPVKTTEVTWKAVDENGNVTTKVQKVTVTDKTTPVIKAPADITKEATARLTPVDKGNAEASDIFKVEVKNDAPDSFAIGTKTVTWTATDEHGNTSTDTQEITIQDTTPPELTIPDDITVEATAVLTPVQIGEATASDIFDVVVTNDAPKDGYPVKTTEVTWKAVDQNGNVTTKVQKVTVTDKTNPVIKAPADITMEATARLTPVDEGNAEASDIFKVEVRNDAPDSYGIGTKTVTWTATDEHGNTSTDTQEITIQDTTPPKLTIPDDITVEATAVLSPVQIGKATATDIFPVMVIHEVPKDNYPIGQTTVIWTAKDINGNETRGEQKITVKDTTPPVLKIPADITVSAAGARTKVSIGMATATDIFDVKISNDAPVDFPIGRTAVTWTVTDANGNTAKAVQYITVVQKLIIKSYNANTNTTTNSVEPRIMLENAGDSTIKLSDLKIRYYFTSEGDKDQNYWCDYAQITGTAGQRNITAIVKGSIAASSGSQCDHYLEISFPNSSEVLKSGEKLSVQGRFGKTDWSLYTQTNDYSFIPSSKDYIETTKVTVYSSGTLIGGIEP
ncbi:MAG TPA: HYR domain-containing protein [Ruminiclostridium sp.]|nr:HYR domain-containing protein [Ruminiclostridium sp.]